MRDGIGFESDVERRFWRGLVSRWLEGREGVFMRTCRHAQRRRERTGRGVQDAGWERDERSFD
jgi:hypothetical protein